MNSSEICHFQTLDSLKRWQMVAYLVEIIVLLEGLAAGRGAHSSHPEEQLLNFALLEF